MNIGIVTLSGELCQDTSHDVYGSSKQNFDYKQLHADPMTEHINHILNA